MTITARYSSYCPCCHQPIDVGDQVEWVKGQKARYTKCPATRKAPAVASSSAPSAPSASSPTPVATAARAARTNSRPGDCDRCGTYVAAGAGLLRRCLGSSSGCFAHGDDEAGGWHVRCADEAACSARRTAAETERTVAAERAAARRAATVRVEEVVRVADNGVEFVERASADEVLRLSVIASLFVGADYAAIVESCNGDYYAWRCPLTDDLRSRIDALRPLL